MHIGVLVQKASADRMFSCVMCTDYRELVHCAVGVPQIAVPHGPTSTHNRFTALFPWPLGWAGARKELLDFVVQGKINRGRHTNHPAGRHSIRTNQCPPPPCSHWLTREPIYLSHGGLCRQPSMAPKRHAHATITIAPFHTNGVILLWRVWNYW